MCDWSSWVSYLGFYSVQRRELRKYNALVSRSSILVGFSFFVGCFGVSFRLGQARAWSVDLLCFVVLKQPRRRRCNSEATLFWSIWVLNIRWFCKTIVVVAVSVCSPVRIACFYLVSVQFNPLPFLERAGPARKKKGVRGNLVKGLIAPHLLGKGM